MRLPCSRSHRSFATSPTAIPTPSLFPPRSTHRWGRRGAGCHRRSSATDSFAPEVPGIKIHRRLALTILAAAAFGAFLPSVALADVWRDIADDTWRNSYGVSAQEAVIVAQGRSDGTFGPGERVNRGQFAKMAIQGLGISLELPETPSFSDVPENHVFFGDVEQCTAAGVMSGYADGTFHPTAAVTREQSCSVLGRWLAEQEIAVKGGIVGTTAPTRRFEPGSPPRERHTSRSSQTPAASRRLIRSVRPTSRPGECSRDRVRARPRSFARRRRSTGPRQSPWSYG